MFRQTMLVQLTFVLILYTRWILGAHAVPDACSICICYPSGIVNCENRRLSSVPYNIPSSTTSLTLSWNYFTDMQPGPFANLYNLKTLDLSDNRIKDYEDGAFLFLPNIIQIDLRSNKDMICGCHLPALVKYMKNNHSRYMDVKGKCQTDVGKRIPILKYSQCSNYSLFQQNLQCQTCSGMVCNDSEVASCPGPEPVCRLTVSMSGITLKFERSCGTYRKCLDVMRNNTVTCNKWTNGTSCVGCCVGNLCNKKDFIGWTNNFEFYLVFKELNKNQIFENMSISIEHELSNLTGTFRVEYCGSEERKNIFTIHCDVIRAITKDKLLLSIHRVLNTSQTLYDLGIQQHDVELIDGMVCNENTSSNNGTFHWPVTKTGSNATLPCHANVATRYCSPRTVGHLEMASSQSMTPLKCSPFTGIWQEPDMSQCYNTEWITQRLGNIRSQRIDQGNIEDISIKVSNVSQKSEYFKTQDVDLAVDILEKMVPVISNVSANVTLSNILLSINDMMDTPEKVLAEAEQASRSVSRLLDIIGTIPGKIPLEEPQVTSIYSNLGIAVAKVYQDTFSGLFYGVSYGTNGTEALLYNHSYPGPRQDEIQTISFISIPESLPKHLKVEERSAFSRIFFFSMKNDKLYRITQNSSADADTNINSYILAASVANIRINNLDEPVNISFILIHQNATNPKCVYWDETPGEAPHWSTKGCKISDCVPGKEVVCSCDHLTSFALLMDVHRNEDDVKHVKPLSIISFIGCGISFVCLVLTVIIHVCFKKLWNLITSKILVSLCVPLGITNLIFVVGMQPYVETLAACKTVAALLHYFLLTSLTWMSFEAIHVLVSMVLVFRTYQASFMKWSSILAWGLPAVIVLITLVINYTDNYVRIGQVCWLSETYFHATFLAPVAAILILNLTIFSLIIWRLISMQKSKKFGHKRRKVRVFGIVGLFFFLGLTWVLAFFAVGEAAEVFKYLFAIFNTLQGMFIFVFYCIYKKDTRDVIINYVTTRKRAPLPTGRNKRSGNETEDKTAEKKL
ncbi:adhesion G-protein coupled receptor G6-like [Octopus sinensis]|uniref:Adhesion G-protein coupled receptor G6-like n=1 Tax=Octopus sinensis TaxID=2607531 RepID=A0A7E6FTB0_9MOLL|nr:adhesion G-protein coupled receptor G6-like [Octopus sinensis]